MRIVIGDAARRRRKELLDRIDGKQFTELTAAERNILLAYLCEQIGILSQDGHIVVDGVQNGAMSAGK